MHENVERLSAKVTETLNETHKKNEHIEDKSLLEIIGDYEITLGLVKRIAWMQGRCTRDGIVAKEVIKIDGVGKFIPYKDPSVMNQNIRMKIDAKKDAIKKRRGVPPKSITGRFKLIKDGRVS